MLETDKGGTRAHCVGSRWRVRTIDNFRRMMLPSGITLATLGGGAAASEIGELDCVGSGVIEARERLGLYTSRVTGGRRVRALPFEAASRRAYTRRMVVR